MTSKPDALSSRYDAVPDTPEGPYDKGPDEDDLWFLGDAEPESAVFRVSRAPEGLIVPRDWRAAEAALAGDLAALCFDLGRLAERLSGLGPGMAERLAQAEAASLSWWLGDRIPADQLALWLGYRIGAMGEDAAGLIRTAWAARRLAAPLSPAAHLAIAAHLGIDGDGPLAGIASDVDTVLAPLEGVHPVTLGCAAFHLWRALDERTDHLRDVEAAVLGARLGAGRHLVFLPLSLAGFGALTTSGTPANRLSAWISGVHQAVLSALLTVDRLTVWRDRALQVTEDLSGRTPRLLIAAFLHQPMVTAQSGEAATGASRAAVQRNLTELTTRGLIREVTGQGRFRVWTARL